MRKMSDKPWTTSQKIDRAAKFCTAEGMMAYVRITLRNYDADQAAEDRKTARLTLIFHAMWIIIGAIVAAIMVALGCDVFLSISVGAIVSLGQEILDFIKGTG
jgi:hypothetical protein